MKRFAVLLLTLAALVWIATPALAQSKAAPGFEKLKSLVGEWQGKKADGQTVNVSYQLISNGSSLMETLTPTKEPSMVTIYHLDGDNLTMTHYCSMANQPRMRAAAEMGEIKKLDFAFVDATNLANAGDAHMSHVVLNFQDKNHFSQEWTMSKDGQKMPAMFSFERKK